MKKNINKKIKADYGKTFISNHKNDRGKVSH